MRLLTAHMLLLLMQQDVRAQKASDILHDLYNLQTMVKNLTAFNPQQQIHQNGGDNGESDKEFGKTPQNSEIMINNYVNGNPFMINIGKMVIDNECCCDDGCGNNKCCDPVEYCCKEGVDGKCRKECEKGEKDTMVGCEDKNGGKCDHKCCVEDPSTTTTISTTPPAEILSCIESNIATNIGRPISKPIKDNRTLAFVFDTTGSMGTDLEQLKAGARKILNATLESPDSHISNFVLVEFNDPGVGPMTVTTDPDEFEASINTIFPSGGGDCPEMALGGIKMALDAVLPKSLIYVFTDASAKDKEKLGDVLIAIQEKKAQVTILMSGFNCWETNDTTYEDIAYTSSSQVYKINKENVNQMLDYLIFKLLNSIKLSLFTEEFDAGENNFELHVDNTLRDITFSVSGPNPSIQIMDPDGEDLEIKGKLEVLVLLENVRIVGITELTPGRYNITVGSESKFTVQAMGVSSINFEYGFSLTPTANFDETTLIPIEGAKHFIIVKPTDLTDFGDLYRIQIMQKDGEIIHDSALKLLPEYTSIYNGTYFIAPEEPFHIKVFGCDQSGSEFERISASAISALTVAKKQLKMKLQKRLQNSWTRIPGFHQ